MTLAFCSIQEHFIRNICAKVGIPNLPISDGGISDFQISGQSLVKENCRNSRTSDGTDMKLGRVTKIHKSKKTTSKNLTVASCRKIETSLPFVQFMANLEQSGSWIPDT